MKYKYITSILVIAFTLSVGILSIVKPDKEISEQEGRTLQVLPKRESFEEGTFKKEVLNGEAFKKWDNYFSDHVLGRNTMVNTYTKIQMLLDKKYINAVYIAEDGDFLEDITYENYDDEYLTKRANHFNELVEKLDDSTNYLVNFPDKNYAYEHKVPIKDYVSAQGIYLPQIFDKINKDNLTIIDMIDEISEGNDNYYKTDHHMNMNGIYTSYETIIKEMQKDLPQISNPKPRKEFDIEKYEEVFTGSVGRKILSLSDDMDDIELYKDKDFTDYKVYIEGEEYKLFNENAITKDRLDSDYAVYLGGNNPILNVENYQSDNDLKVVAIGDSMDNPLIPLLAPHFKELYSYDLRYYQGDVVSDIEDINPDVVMIMGLGNGFIVESEIFKWKRE